jgi:cytochrome P450
LTAVVEESFRLGAPLGFFARVAPKGGAIIAGTDIPEDTIVGVPVWAQMTSEENFAPDPFVFRPERWLLMSGDGDDEKNDDKSRHGRPEVTKLNKSAVMTFSHGKYVTRLTSTRPASAFVYIPLLIFTFG